LIITYVIHLLTEISIGQLHWLPVRVDIVRHLIVAGLFVLAAAPSRVPASGVRPPVAAPPAAADFNGDGAADVATVVRGRIRVTLADRDAVELDGVRHVARVAAADVDRDGDPDLVAVTHQGALRVFRNDGQGRLLAIGLRPRSTGVGNASNGTLDGHSREMPTTDAPLRGAPAITIARIAAFPVLARAGPCAEADVAIRLTGVSARSPRAPPLPISA
jgi:hypothetical protein